MSGEELCGLLNALGYRPRGRSLSPYALEWMFTSESTRPFLTWLCRSISRENLLTDLEIEKLARLAGCATAGEEECEEGADVEVEGEQRDQIAMYRERVLSLEGELARKELESAGLVRRCDFIRSRLLSERASVCSLSGRFEREREQMRGAILPRVYQMFDCLKSDVGELSEGLRRLEASYSSLFGRELGEGCLGGDGCFASCLDWSEYYEQEDRCCEDALREIGADGWWRELKGRLGGEEEKWRDTELCELVSLEKESANRCLLDEDRLHAELSRLQSAYAINEKLKLDRDISLARALAVLKMVKCQESNKQRYRIMNALTLKSKIDQVSGQLDQVRLTARAHLDTLSSRIHTEMPQLLSLPVLRACEAHKIAFQERLLARMNCVEQRVTEQLARYRLLSLVLDRENSVHVEVYSMVMALKREVQELRNSAIDRLGFMQARIEHQQEYLGSPSAASLSLLLQLVLEKTVSASARELPCAAREIKKRIEAAEGYFGERGSMVDLLARRGLSTPCDSLISPVVEGRYRELREAVSAFGNRVESVLKEYALVKKTITELPKKRRLERNLWIYFFGDYTFLQKVQEELYRSRLKMV